MLIVLIKKRFYLYFLSWPDLSLINIVAKMLVRLWEIVWDRERSTALVNKEQLKDKILYSNVKPKYGM